MPNYLHSHNYNGVTSVTDRHDHRYIGRTNKEPDVRGHTHLMEGYTTRDDGHIHFYRLRTGPAVYRQGGHYHYYQGDTDVADRHTHGMNGYTSLD